MKGKKKGKLHTSRRLRHKEKINRPGATGYIARSQVTKRLQLNIAQFRQLCIYKGVHPVEPGLKRIRKNVAKTWYYLKDVNFMKRDEVMTWFRDIKTYKKRVLYLKEAKRPAELAALKERKPKINMDHFVRERYPTLQDAVNDLDDALSLITLFVEMQYGITAKIMQKKQFAECIRLKSEWMAYVAETHSLRKVFVSIKGIYYQADVLGSTTTWLAPHPQRIQVPVSVDVLTMCFFVNFYITMLNFVLYRLYTDMGYQYPPKIDAKLMSLEENVKAVKLEKIAPKAATLKTESTPTAPVAHPAPLTAIDRERIAIVNSKLAHIIAVDAEQSSLNADEVLPAVEVKEEPKEEDGEIPEEFRKIDEEAGENKEQYHRTSALFSGLKFLINREIPKVEIRFMIRAFGGEDFTEYDVDGKDNRITHQIVDRDWDKTKMLLNREYVQPQWIFDSINAGILLPYHEYAPDAVLPPHISPFINDALKGYVPKQRDHINELIEQQKKDGGEKVQEGGVEKEEPDSEDDKYVGEGEDDDDGTTIEAKYAQELAAEQEGKTYAGYVEDELGQTDMYPSDGSDDSDVDKALKKKKKTNKEIIAEKQKEDEEDRERMSIDLLNAKTRKIVRSIKGRLERSKSSNEALEEKRRAIEKKQKKEARAARHILPKEPITTTTTTTTTIPTRTPGAGKKRKQERALNGNNFAKKVKK